MLELDFQRHDNYFQGVFTIQQPHHADQFEKVQRNYDFV